MNHPLLQKRNSNGNALAVCRFLICALVTSASTVGSAELSDDSAPQLAGIRPLPAAVWMGPFTNPANGHAYYLLHVNAWFGAELEARNLEGHLAIPDDADENDWIVRTFQPFTAKAWIGIHDAVIEGELRSVDGRTVRYTRIAPRGGDNSDTRDFLEIDMATGEWTFQPSLVARHAIVEVAPTPDVLAGPIQRSGTDSEYYLLSDSTWKKAQRKARELGGNLTTISSPEENAWVVAQFGRWDPAQPIWLWIGLSDEEVEGIFDGRAASR